MKRPNVEQILDGLKDFQRTSVDYVFDRLYIDDDPAHRFLVADEVGLGKTLVARGLIAKAIDHLWDRTDRIDIVYICSSLEIASQNIRRLQVGVSETPLPTRLTLLPRQVKNLRENRINFVSLTPGTSFNLKTAAGRREERALLFQLLKRAWRLRISKGNVRLLQGGVKNSQWFEEEIRRVPELFELDRELTDRFAERVVALDEQATRDGELSMRDEFRSLAAKFASLRRLDDAPKSLRQRQRTLIARLRTTLAESCLEALDPDLIILDEFQRFKDLLHGDSDAALLAKRLFGYQHEELRARVILLSATPYKMYTLSEEAAEDDHYQDFLRTLRFLFDDEGKTQDVADLLDRYRRSMYQLVDGEDSRAYAIRDELRYRLSAVMVRTERLASTKERDGMLTERPAASFALRVDDVVSYAALRRIAGVLDQPDPMEFWKSSPYLLNFMDRYRFRESFDTAVEDGDEGLAPVFRGDGGLLLRWNDVRAYRGMDPNNARLRSLVSETVDAGMWELLWIPPSLPYYQLEEPFASPSMHTLTKRLVFSSWVVVPKVIACLISYEAERRMMRASRRDPRPKNTATARRSKRGRLQFTISEGRPTGMPVLALMYPSPTLAKLGDPLRLIAERGGAAPTIRELLSHVGAQLEAEIDALIEERAIPRSGNVDQAWYWAAPLFLDAKHDSITTKRWWDRSDTTSIWSGTEDEPQDDEASGSRGWHDHVEHALDLLYGDGIELGRPPDDLVEVVARLAVAGPGTATLRALSRITEKTHAIWLRDAAANAAWGFRSLFNLPEVMAMIDGLNDAEPYWLRVLEYCTSGGLQSVLDEYAHVSREALGLIGGDGPAIAERIGAALRTSLSLRTPNLGVSDIRVTRLGKVSVKSGRMRTSFALRFSDAKDADAEQTSRPEQVREAFNSPFWPFVLATTSVGQEGLDFHQYCHAVVHWNLPSNPVDLEQREGRVHRYKGHAVRKNLVERYASAAWLDSGDPWQLMFDAAVADRPPDRSDIVPFWVLEGSSTIERIVPALPLSRDAQRLEALRSSLALYRVVFGQPRQDDLLHYLMTRIPEEDLLRTVELLRINLSPFAR